MCPRSSGYNAVPTRPPLFRAPFTRASAHESHPLPCPRPEMQSAELPVSDRTSASIDDSSIDSSAFALSAAIDQRASQPNREISESLEPRKRIRVY